VDANADVVAGANVASMGQTGPPNVSVSAGVNAHVMVMILVHVDVDAGVRTGASETYPGRI